MISVSASAGRAALLLVLTILAMPAPAAAQSEREPNLSGRWQDAARRVTLDIIRCGNEWCGVEIRGEGCGTQVLRLVSSSDTSAWFEGRLDFAGPQRRYAVRASFANGVIDMHGDNRTPAFLARTMPLRLELARTGPAQCVRELHSS